MTIWTEEWKMEMTKHWLVADWALKLSGQQGDKIGWIFRDRVRKISSVFINEEEVGKICR